MEPSKAGDAHMAAGERRVEAQGEAGKNHPSGADQGCGVSGPAAQGAQGNISCDLWRGGAELH